MCFYTQQTATIKEVENRFNAKIDSEERFLNDNFINGFSTPNLPIILGSNPNIITTNYSWGLMPSWAKDTEIRKKTLNARVETINEKPSFKNITQNRCLIIATGYYDWRWEDNKGAKKEKYIINSHDEEIFTLAGLHSNWKNPSTGEELNTFTIITTEANEIMKYVHNHKQRMPIMINKKDELSWLNNSTSIENFSFPYQSNLRAVSTK